jgi:SAM-dependent methyltransferase
MQPHGGVRDFPVVVRSYGWLTRLVEAAVELPRFLGAARTYRASTGSGHRFELDWRHVSPYLHEAEATAGFDRHYLLHTAWAARVLQTLRPGEHCDISSSLYFSALVSAFVPVRFFDYRRVTLSLTGFSAGTADLLGLPFETGSLNSLSCMHVVEHVGLGRYGEPLDPDGDLRAIEELQRVVAPGGALLFVVPVAGSPRLVFNAHRIYTLPMVLDRFAEQFALREFALIPDDPADGDLVTSPPPDLLDRQAYGCGCFWFEKHSQAAPTAESSPRE